MSYVNDSLPSAGSFVKDSKPSGSSVNDSQPSSGSYVLDTKPTASGRTKLGVPMGLLLSLTYATSNGYLDDSSASAGSYSNDIKP